MHYFFIETAQQFVFAKEVAKSLDLSEYKLINITFNKADRLRIRNLRKEEKNLPLHDLGIDIKVLSARKKFFVDIYKLAVIRFYLLFILKQNDSIYVACYFKPYFWRLLNSSWLKKFLYDDGLKTITSEAVYTGALIRNYNPSRASFRILHFLFQKRLHVPEYKFYTFFEAKGANFIKLEFKKDIDVYNTSLNDEIWFVGQPLIQMRKIDFQLFSFVIEKIKNQFPGKSIIYFPHPKELDVKKYFSGEVRMLSQPFELYINKQKTLPLAVISFNSASIILAKVLNKEIRTKLMYIRHDKTESISKFLEIAEERYGIEVINI